MIRLLAAAKRPTMFLLSWWLVGQCSSNQVAGQGTRTTVGYPFQGVVRTTNDREADLIDALVRAGRFDDAESVCKSRLQAADPQSDLSAKWAIRHSRVLTARQMSRDTFDETEVQKAQRPTVDLMRSYANHSRRLFLEAQNLSVEREAAIHHVLRAAVAPSNDEARETAFRRLLRATTAVQSLAERIGDSRSQLESRPAAREFALVADLVRLQQELQVDAVSMALMQTDLFPRGSDDCIAAATKAEEAADEAIARLPSDTPARREVERLKVEAIFRAGQLSRAGAELGQLIRAYVQPLPPRVLAMKIRIDIANQDLRQAQDRLDAFYGRAPAAAPRSIDMDLARLEFLMLGDHGSEVGAWLDSIEQRGGAYARRRAEAISLARLRRMGSAQNRTQMVDPSLIAAQGQDWLRRGEPGRAGDLLSAAAAAESDPDRAIRHASEAAAAFVSAGRTRDAANALADLSIANPDGRNAAAAHLQAAVLVSSMNLPNASDRIESLLRANLRTWPTAESAGSVRTWLLKLMQSQNRQVDAAEIATQIPVQQVTADDADTAIELWRTAFRSIEPQQFSETATRFESAFRLWLEREDLRSTYVMSATLLLDRDALAALPEQASGDSFVDALREFRQSPRPSVVLQSPPAELMDDAIWRLMRDGRTNPQARSSIAKLIQSWVDSATPSIEQAERLLWIGQVEQSITLLRRLVAESPKSVEIIKQAAELLGSADSQAALRSAIEFWDQLAAGTTQGGRVWHQAKLAAIGLLRRIGNEDDARQRAKYILLTKPDMDAMWKQQYEAALK